MSSFLDYTDVKLQEIPGEPDKVRVIATVSILSSVHTRDAGTVYAGYTVGGDEMLSFYNPDKEYCLNDGYIYTITGIASRQENKGSNLILIKIEGVELA